MREFFTAQMDCIFFFYGLAFILMAVAAYFISRKRPAQNFWKWIALFGLIHGISEWLDMFVFSLGDSAPFKIVRIAFLIASFLCFTEVVRLDARKRWGKLSGSWVYVPLLSVTVGAGWILGGLTGVNILSRHILGLIGGLLAVRVIVTSLASQDEEGKDPVLSLFVWFLACYFTTQFFAAKGTFLPASMINQDAFFSFLGFPVQLFRMVLALVLASIAWTGYLLELLQRFSKEEKVKRFRKDLWFPASLTILLLAGWITVEVAGQDKKVEERKDLVQISKITAGMIDPDGIKALSGTPADLQNGYYKRLQEQFLKIAENERDLNCIYLVGKRNGKNVFLFDLDQKSVLGEGVYEGNSKLLNRMFSSGGAVTVGPEVNKWGAFVSSLVAINDPADGKVIAVLGFDHDIKVWNTHIAVYRLKYILILFLFTVLYIVFFVMFKREQEIRQNVQAMGELLRKSQERFQNLVETSFDWIWECDAKGIYTYVSPAIKGLLGYEVSEVLGKTPFDLMPEEEGIKIKKIFEEKIANKEVFRRLENTNRHKDGHLVILETSGIPILGENGRLKGYRGTDRDITERKMAELYREMGDEILRILSQPGEFRDIIRHVIVTLKSRMGFDAVGMRLQEGDDFPFCGQEGFSKDFLLKENTLTERGADGGICRDSEGHIRLECTCGLVISGKADFSSPFFTNKGSFWTNDSFPLLELPSAQDPRRNPRNQCIHQGYASVALVPLRVENKIIGLLQFNDRRKGRFTLHTMGFLEDIAERIAGMLMRKQAEEQLQASEEKLRSIIDNISVGITLISPEMEILSLNNQMKKWFPKIDLKSKPICYRAFNDPPRAEICSYCPTAKTLKDGLVHEDVTDTSVGGKIFNYRIISSPVMDKTGKVTAAIEMVDDVTELRRMEEEKARLLAIIDESKDFIGVADLQGNLLYHNPAAKKMVGLPVDADMSHMKIKDMHPGWAAKIIEEEGIPAILKEGSWKNETVLLHRNGNEIPVSQLLLLHRDPLSGKPAFISTIMRDITQEKRLTEALGKSRESLESQVNERTAELARSFQKLQVVDENLKQASKAKSEFLANMSHELRTPLNSIIGFSEVLHDERFGPLNERQKRYTENVMVSGRHLLALINEVLDLSKVEAGKMVLAAFSFPIRDCIEEMMGLLESQALSKKIKPVLEVPGDFGEIHGDKRKIQQVISNLLSNAIKFTQPGGKIGVRARRIEDGIEVTVWDTGAGIAPENLEKAFGAFERLASPYTQETEGTGLGLTISKKLVELHGGKIWIESGGEGKGTAVKFTIPSGAVK